MTSGFVMATRIISMVIFDVKHRVVEGRTFVEKIFHGKILSSPLDRKHSFERGNQSPFVSPGYP